MSLRTIMIFPEFDNIDIIDEIRAKYDPLAKLVRPHITIVFPFEMEITNDELSMILENRLRDIKSFEIEMQGFSKCIITKISVEMIGENEESIIVIEKKLR